MTTPLVSRAEWGARQPNCSSTNITPEAITAHYWGGSPWGAGGIGSHDRCASIVRAGQAYHMDGHGWCDIAYTSLVCPHGFRFEGRGPGKRTAANGTNDGNQRSYAVCYLGGDGDPLTDEAKLAFLDEAARLGVPLRWGHREWLQTGCPGSPVWAWRQAGFPRPGATPAPTPQPTPGHQHPMPLVRFTATGTPDNKIHGEVFHPEANRWFVQDYRTPWWEVRDVQTHLLVHGYSVGATGADGIGGPSTRAALLAFQRDRGLSPDAVVGKNTWPALHG